MQKKSLETILYSSAGVLVMLVILIAVNVLTGARPLRADLTQDQAFTLSAGTKAILRQLDTPVTIRFYCSQSDTATPESVYLRDYARKVADLLQEYHQIAGKNLIIQKFDPQPDSDAEDSARLDGLEPQSLPGVDQFYLGLSVNLLDTHVAIPFLSPDREKLLEYDLTRAISQVMNPTKPVVGVMSALPVFGQPANPMMQMQGEGQAGTPAWTFIQQLQQDYQVRQIPLDATQIDADVKVLVVIHPKGIGAPAQFALDQFVLRGGKLIAFLDPFSATAARQQQNPMMGEAGPESSTLDALLPAWGLQFDTGKVVADLDFKMQLSGASGNPEDAPAWLALTPDGMNRNDIVTGDIGAIWLPLCGAFTGVPATGLTETVLLHSSRDAELADASMASQAGPELMNGFKATGVVYPLAIRLTGRFTTAFPQGDPAGSATNAAPRAAALKQSVTPTTVVLFGDADLLADDFSLRKEDSPFGPMVTPMNANLDLAQNLVEQMAGDENLIAVRSRATMSRPFTRIKAMEAAAEAQGEARIADLQQSLQETQQRLGDLQQQKKGADQRYILSPEQRAQVDDFQKKQAETSRELRQAQKDLHREVTTLETRIEWLNILAVPLAVTLAGLLIAWMKRNQHSAP